MSEDILSIIPTDPTWVPTRAQAKAVRTALQRLVDTAATVTDEVLQQVAFIDAGENFESTRCPTCHAGVDQEWWAEAMARAAEADFTDLAVTTPCCASPTTLNDLIYEWPQGFARWTLTVENPARGPLTPKEHAVLAKALAHPIREIWSHY